MSEIMIRRKADAMRRNRPNFRLNYKGGQRAKRDKK